MLRDRFHAFLQARYQALSPLADEDYFADEDVLTSFEMLQLVLELEREFGITVEDQEMTEENIGCKAGLLAMIERKLGPGA